MTYKPDNIPQCLKDQKRWALSAEGQVDRRGDPYPTKAPMIPIHGKDYVRPVSSTDPSAWRTFEEVDAHQDIVGGFPGLMLGNTEGNEDGNFIGFDFDLEKSTPEIKTWVENEVLPRAPKSAYIERSPSGTGYRVIVKGQIKESRKTAAIEIYKDRRYLRMTGNVFKPENPQPTEEQRWIDWVCGSLGEKTEYENVEDNEVGSLELMTPADLELLLEDVKAWAAENEPAELAQLEQLEDPMNAAASGDARSAVIIFAKAGCDRQETYNLLLGMEAVQNYYGQKNGDKAASELARKFQYWWPEAQGIAATWHDTHEKDLKVIPMIMAMLDGHLAQRADEAAERQAKIATTAKTAEKDFAAPTAANLPDHGSALLHQYAEYLGAAQYDSENGMNILASVLHGAVAISRNFITSSGQTSNLYTIISARKGLGKGVFGHSEWTGDKYAQRTVGLPGSQPAFHKSVARSPSGLLVIEEVGDKFQQWQRKGDQNNSTFHDLKKLFTHKQGSQYQGLNYSDSTKSVQPIQSPAFSLIGEGTHKQVYDALRAMGTEDGFVGRFLFYEGGEDAIENYDVEDEMPEPVRVAFDILLACDPIGPAMPHPTRVPIKCQQMHRDFMDEGRAGKKREDVSSTFWRSASMQAQRLALVPAVFKALERGYDPTIRNPDEALAPVITEVEYGWAIEMVKLSIATGTYQAAVRGAYSHDEVRLGSELVRVLRRWTRGSGLSPAALKAQEKGYFTAGGLGDWGSEFRNHPDGSTKAKGLALQYLLSEEIIEYHGLKRNYGANYSGVQLQLGPNWQVEG